MLAKEANVENLGFYHHDPDRNDDDIDTIVKTMIKFGKQENCQFNMFGVKELDVINL
jgi:hypothetical protein